MYLTSEVLPEGSFILRGFLDPDTEDESDIELVVVLKNLGAGIAEVAAAKGDMTSEGNIALGLKAIELGFKALQFHVVKNTRVTRWAEYVSSDENFDYYRVDLINSEKELNS